MMFIRKIRIENFKILKDVTIGDLENLSIFIGRNSAGKSSILDAVRAFRLIDGQADVRAYAFDKNPRNRIRIDIGFQLQDKTRESILARLFEDFAKIDPDVVLDSPFLRTLEYRAIFHPISDTNCQVLLDKILTRDLDGETIEVYRLNHQKVIQCEVLDLRGACSQIVGEDMNLRMISQNWVGLANVKVKGSPTGHPQIDVLRGFLLDTEEERMYFSYGPYRRAPASQDKFGSLLLSADGANLPQVLDTFYLRDRDGYDEMEETIRKLVPEIERLRAYPKGNTTSPLISERGLKSSFLVGEIGTGLEQLLILVVGISVAKKGSIICIEEPEIHHHAQTQRNFFNFLKRQSSDKQFLIVTHSSVFVDRSRTSDTFLVSKSKGESSVSRVTAKDYDDIMLELGLRKSDVFQADGIVLVEGESDKHILESLAKVVSVDLDEMNISILPVGGKDSMTFYANARVLVESRTPFRVILDGDGLDPEAIRRKLLGLTKEGKRIKSTAENRVCRKTDVIVLREHSIESYLLVPRAISVALAIDEEQVEKYLRQRTGKNKKRVLDGLVKNMLNRSYQEVADGARIARHMRKSEIHPELRRIISQRLVRLVKSL